MLVRLLGAGAVSLGAVIGCQRGPAVEDAKQPPGQPTPAATAEVPSSGAAPTAACTETSWPSITIREPSGVPSVALRHASTWQIERLASNRLRLTAPAPGFQVIVSVLSGPTYGEEQLRKLDEGTMGRYPVLEPWRKVEGGAGFQAFTVTRDTQPNIFEIRYYAGAGGLVVVSVESFERLGPAAISQWQSFLRCLEISFA
jgi:hypothetical protein